MEHGIGDPPQEEATTKLETACGCKASQGARSSGSWSKLLLGSPGQSEFELDLRAVQGLALNLSRDAVSDETSGSVMRFQTFLFLFGHGRAHARLARNTRPSRPQKRI